MDLKSPTMFQMGASFRYGPPSSVLPRLSDQEKQTQALTIARALEPKKVVGFDKVRVGRNFDGGYIHINDFSEVNAALSFGISDDASWDLDIAKRNIPVQQFDHTIDKAPIKHPLITFHKQRIAQTDGSGAVCFNTITDRFLSNCPRAILKIDIEGDEWSVFAATSLETLGKFSQIVCEFHGFQHAGDPAVYSQMMEVLTKLRLVFEVVHVHGNNAAPFVSIANMVMPALLEITFANRNHYEFIETNEVFPIALDQPNLPNVPEMRLGCFKF